MYQIKTLEENETFFNEAIKEVLEVWCSNDLLIQTLNKFDISPDTFKEKYASKIVNYYVDVVNAKATIGNCPYANQMIDDFLSYDMRSEDIFIICSQFRLAFVEVVIDANIESKKILKEMFYLMDMNFKGVLKYYESKKKYMG
jgi:hypothetical protein